MRVWAKLLLIALPLLGCNGETFQKGNEKSAIVDSPLEDKDSRPQETGEGLPGYLFCNSQDVSDSQTDLSCRIEADQEKVDLSGQKVVWNYTNTPGVTLNTLVQEISSPWHVIYQLQGSAEDRQNALDNGAVLLEIDDASFAIPSNSVIEGVFGAGAQFMFGPEASGRLNDWLGLNLNTPTGDPLNSSMGTSLGNLELELKPLLGDLTPLGPAAAAGTSPWAEMSDSAIGTLGSMEILIKGLNPGQYAINVYLSNSFISEATVINLQYASEAGFTAPFSQTLNPDTDQTFNATDVLEFRFNSNQTVHFRLSTEDNQVIPLHSLTIKKLAP